jgi:glycosyltransferase involved in cell wall biosynthesis
MKILFTSPILEHPPAGGPQLRIENSIKALSKVSELFIISRNAEYLMGGKDATEFYTSFTRNFSFGPSIIGLSANKYIRKVQRVYRRLFTSGLLADAQYIVKIAKENNINIIWFGYGNISYDLIKLVKKLEPEFKIICDTDSVWSRFVLRELPYETDPKRIEKIKSDGTAKELEEADWVNVCDVTTAVSDVDLNYYSNLAADKSKVMLFSNVIDLETYKNLPSKPEGFKKPSVYLAGTFGPKSAMDKAARWFIEDIYPLVKKEIPDIHFYIVGNGSKQTLSDIEDDSISIMGKMPSVLPYLCNTDVSLVPLRFESGTRFKIMEAAACKIPIVSTTLGAEGIPVEHGKDILIADEPQQFANAIINLIKDKRYATKIADNCYSLISRYNSVDSLCQEAKKIIERLTI